MEAAADWFMIPKRSYFVQWKNSYPTNLGAIISAIQALEPPYRSGAPKLI
jgi:hypothetical protein